MEKNKKSKTKKPVTKKTTTRKVTKSKKKKSKVAFTLIELLAVIIILGILILIAIPSVTKYISDSRKETYIDTARQYVKGAVNLTNQGKLDMFDTDTTYYIPSTCIKLESGGDSPYGKFDPAYVIVTYDNESYNYYWLSRDVQGMGIDNVTLSDKLDANMIKSGVKKDVVSAKYGIDGRDNIVLFSADCSSKTTSAATTSINGDTGEEITRIQYPTGKNKETVTTGDIAKINNEEFYVIRHNGNDLLLLARYNLKVGGIYSGFTKKGQYTSADDGYGLQSSETRGVGFGNLANGTLAFSSTNYWGGKIGTVYPGTYCSSTSSSTSCANIFDSNSYLYQYVVNYKNYLESFGIAIKEARLMSTEEYNYIRTKGTFWKETSYWLGNPYYFDGNASPTSFVNYVEAAGSGYSGSAAYSYNSRYGIRPVIII